MALGLFALAQHIQLHHLRRVQADGLAPVSLVLRPLLFVRPLPQFLLVNAFQHFFGVGLRRVHVSHVLVKSLPQVPEYLLPGAAHFVEEAEAVDHTLSQQLVPRPRHALFVRIGPALMQLRLRRVRHFFNGVVLAFAPVELALIVLGVVLVDVRNHVLHRRHPLVQVFQLRRAQLVHASVAGPDLRRQVVQLVHHLLVAFQIEGLVRRSVLVGLLLQLIDPSGQCVDPAAQILGRQRVLSAEVQSRQHLLHVRRQPFRNMLGLVRLFHPSQQRIGRSFQPVAVGVHFFPVLPCLRVRPPPFPVFLLHGLLLFLAPVPHFLPLVLLPLPILGFRFSFSGLFLLHPYLHPRILEGLFALLPESVHNLPVLGCRYPHALLVFGRRLHARQLHVLIHHLHHCILGHFLAVHAVLVFKYRLGRVHRFHQQPWHIAFRRVRREQRGGKVAQLAPYAVQAHAVFLAQVHPPKQRPAEGAQASRQAGRLRLLSIGQTNSRLAQLLPDRLHFLLTLRVHLSAVFQHPVRQAQKLVVHLVHVRVFLPRVLHHPGKVLCQLAHVRLAAEFLRHPAHHPLRVRFRQPVAAGLLHDLARQLHLLFNVLVRFLQAVADVRVEIVERSHIIRCALDLVRLKGNITLSSELLILYDQSVISFFFQFCAIFFRRHVFKRIQHRVQIRLHRIFKREIYLHRLFISRFFPQIIFRKPESHLRTFYCCFITGIPAGVFSQPFPVKHSKFRVRSMVHHQRFSILVHHLAVSKPAFKLLRFSLLHKFPVDRGTSVEYTMDEAVLYIHSGELDPGPGEQATSLGLFPVIHAGFTGVFFLDRIRQHFGDGIPFSECRSNVITINK